eukprot:12621036-Alexandrium_andersonii.AAC.1
MCIRDRPLPHPAEPFAKSRARRCARAMRARLRSRLALPNQPPPACTLIMDLSASAIQIAI